MHAILGGLITPPALQLVWWRMLLVSVALAPVVTALVEPALTGARFERHNLLLGLAVIPGVALVVGGIPGTMHAGFWRGVVSAVLAAFFNVLNRRFLGARDPLAVTARELGAGFLLVTWILSSVLPGVSSAGQVFVWPSVRDGAWLLVLALLCTLVPYAVSLGTLRRLSSFTVQLAINLEPVYAITIAVLFLGEARELSGLFFIGVATVLAAVFGHAWLQIGVFRRTRSLTDERPSV